MEGALRPVEYVGPPENAAIMQEAPMHTVCGSRLQFISVSVIRVSSDYIRYPRQSGTVGTAPSGMGQT